MAVRNQRKQAAGRVCGWDVARWAQEVGGGDEERIEVITGLVIPGWVRELVKPKNNFYPKRNYFAGTL